MMKSFETTVHRHLALGDSYTVGEGVTQRESWPFQLWKGLRDLDQNFMEPFIVAKTGWTTRDLAAEIQRINPGGIYDLVSLLIGVNDQYQGEPVEGYAARFKVLLETAIQFAGGISSRVLVLSIPNWGLTPFGQRSVGRTTDQITAELLAYNRVNRDAARQVKAPYIDIYPHSVKLGWQSGYLAADELHPSGAMYACWAQMVIRRMFPRLD